MVPGAAATASGRCGTRAAAQPIAGARLRSGRWSATRPPRSRQTARHDHCGTRPARHAARPRPGRRGPSHQNVEPSWVRGQNSQDRPPRRCRPRPRCGRPGSSRARHHRLSPRSRPGGSPGSAHSSGRSCRARIFSVTVSLMLSVSWRQLGAQRGLEVVGDVPDGHRAGVEAGDHLVGTPDPTGTRQDQPRGDRLLTIARDRTVHIAGRGRDRCRCRAVARVRERRVVAFIARRQADHVTCRLPARSGGARC